MDLTTFMFIGLLNCHLVTSWTSTESGSLQTTLLTGYVTNTRPEEITNIDLDFGISSLNDLNIVSQQINVLGYLLVLWSDPRLTWSSETNGNISDLHLTSSLVWTPPLVLNNAGDEIKVLSDNTNVQSVPVKVRSTGSVAWLIPVSFSASCSVNIEYYPFDQQKCSLLVSTWMYSVAQLTITHQSDSINTELYEENGEWVYSGGEVEATNRTLHGFPMPAIRFTLTFYRREKYYIINVILPVAVLSFLAFLVFLLPVDSGERIGYALTILLSLSVVLSTVSDSIPPTSTHTCVLSVYLLTIYSTSALEAFLTVLIVRMYLREDSDSHLSPGLIRLMKKFLVPVSRYRRSGSKVDDTISVLDLETKRTEVKRKNKIDKLRELTNRRPQSAWKNDDDNDEVAHDDDDDICYTYKDLSKVMDILCFYTFLILTIIISLVFFLILTLGA